MIISSYELAALLIDLVPPEYDEEYIFSGPVSLEQLAKYLHFEQLRSAFLRKLEKKPFRQFLVSRKRQELTDDDYRGHLRKYEVYIREKEIDFKGASKDDLPDIYKYNGLENKRAGIPMNAIHFAQFEVADALGIEKGQSLYRFANYKNIKNEVITDYYKKYDKVLLENMPLYSVSPDDLLPDQKIMYAVQAINFDLLENERAMEFIYRLAVSFAQQENQTYESLRSAYFPFVQLMVGTQTFPYRGQNLTISRHPVLFLDQYIAEIPQWDETQRAKERERFYHICALSVRGNVYLKKLYDGYLDLDEEQLADKICQAVKDYPIFDAYGISKRTTGFFRKWPGKTLTYYRKLAGEIYSPRKNTGASKE